MLQLCCISYYSYIKPQPQAIRNKPVLVVYRTIPTSNHNSSWLCVTLAEVVYRTIPTSNHNFRGYLNLVEQLYIVLFLHQTTTWDWMSSSDDKLYIVLFLHQTTTIILMSLPSQRLYIVLFLHQTTTQLSTILIYRSCISYYSYIKPQPIMLIQLIISILLSLSLIRNSKVGSKTIQKY